MQIGLLVLVALACKNAILIVEFANEQQRQGEAPKGAAQGAARIRFRPIIMTSLAFIGGVYPLVVATGAGAEMRQSLGTAVFSGMIGVGLFGIFLTPVFFFLLMRLGSHKPPRVLRAAEGGTSEHVRDLTGRDGRTGANK